ncbi:MAG TPA: hypothetical protein VF365_03765 [Candidatus Limnocylindria bacterium]
MHPTRRSLAAVMAIALMSGALAGPVAAAAPDNDDVANALVVDTLPFAWSGDLGEATSEAGEPFGCHNGGSADLSTWFAWTAPDTGTMRVITGAAPGDSQPTSDTNTAVFGPYDGVPAGMPTVDDLRFCVNGVGDEFALVEGVGAGETYLFQLSAVSTAETNASIRIDFDASAQPQIAIAPTGGVSRIAGFARVAVGIACLDERPFWGVVSIHQRVTRTALARGATEISGTCTQEVAWYDVFVGPGDTIPFAAGWAEVDFYVEVSGSELHTDTAYTVTMVRLRMEGNR